MMRRGQALLCGGFSMPAARAVLPDEIRADAVSDCQGWFGIGQGLANAADNWKARPIAAFSF